MHKGNRLNRLAQAMLVALSMTGQAHAQQAASAPDARSSERQIAVDIAEQPLETALDRLAEQTGLQIIYPTQGFPRGLASTRIVGSYPVGKVLSQLLAPANMTYEFVNARTVTIRAMSGQETAGTTTAGGAQTGAVNEQLDTVIVTGTNLMHFDPASPYIIIDQEQMQRRGASTLEDVLRNLPQNLNARSSAAAALGEKESGALYSPISGLGNTSVNLRGMGSASTLILVNGRRRATSAHATLENSSFTDISSIPLSQVDYIEVLTDGASAIYGADAVSGVVNIVLKKEYAGTTMQLRHENSSNQADNSLFNIGHTFGWGTGTLTATASVERNKPTDITRLIRKGPMGIGDFTAEGGVNTRKRHFGTPGAVYDVVDMSNPFYMLFDLPKDASGRILPPLGYIPSGQDGTSLGAADLLAPGSQPMRSHYEQARIGPQTDRKAVRLEGTQDLGNNFVVYYGAGYTRQTDQEHWRPNLGDFNTIGLLPLHVTYVRADNVHNPFGRDVGVAYTYEKEFDGIRLSANQRQNNLDGYLQLKGDLRWIDGWHFETGVSYSGEQGRADDIGDGGAQFYDPLLARRFFTNINPFGNGSNNAVVEANRQLLLDLVGRTIRDFGSSQITWDGMVRGKLFEMPAGSVEMALGSQLRTEKNRSNIDYGALRDNLLIKSNRDSGALFAEVGFPLLKDKPFAKSLDLTIAARHERYRQSGNSALSNEALIYDMNTYQPVGSMVELGGFDLFALTGVTVAPFDPADPYARGQRVDVKRQYTNTSPLARIAWKPIDNLRVRATWGKSYVTPTGYQLFGELQAYDATFMVQFNGGTVPAGVTSIVQLSGPNPNLKPQIATTSTIGFDFNPSGLPGLALTATYSHIKFDNYIGSPTGDYMQIKDVFTPGAVLPPGTLTVGKNGVMLWDRRDINYLGRTSRSIDLGAGYYASGAWGDWRVDFNASRMLELSVQTTPGLPVVKLMDTENGPTKWTGDLLVAWDKGDFNAALGAHYSSGFSVVNPLSAWPNSIYNDPYPNPNPRRQAGSHTTLDAQVGYRPQTPAGWLSGLNVTLGVQNIFNRQFAFVDNFYGMLSSRGNVRGRVLYLDIKKEF